MAWSYRADRADEIYTASGGPAVADAEKITKPPGDAQVPEPKEDAEKRLKEAREQPTPDKNESLPGVTRADLEVLRRQRMDPEAGHEVMTPEARAKAESELIQKTADLERTRLENMEKNRMYMEERARLEQEEREKENEKIRADAKKAAEDDKKKADEEKKKVAAQNEPKPTEAKK